MNIESIKNGIKSAVKWVLGKREIKREIIVSAEKLETRVAVVENGRVEEFQVEQTSSERLVGSIYKGRIQNLENDLQAAFVDIGLGKNAFLHYWDMFPDDESRLDIEDGETSQQRVPRRKRYTNEQIAKRFPVGSDIIVQVSKGPIGTKGPRITTSLSIPGRYLVMMPGCKMRGVSRKIGDAKERQRLKKILDRLPLPDDIGLIVRTIGAGASKRAFVRDVRNLVSIWQDLQDNIKNKPPASCVYQEPDLVERVVRDSLTEDVDRVLIDDLESYQRIKAIAARISRRSSNLISRYEGQLPIFDAKGVESQLQEAFRRKVNLKGGGYLVIDETEALIAIDVNTGRHKGKGSQEDAILEVNLEAVEEVARQLRIRNIGGLVVLDLIDMKSRKHQQQVYRALKSACRRDKARTNVTPISELGLLEMTRQRFEQSLLSQMHNACPYCHGHGTIKSPLQLSVDIQRRLRSLTALLTQEKKETDLQICIHPSVLDRLRTADEAIIRDILSHYGAKISFKSEPLRQAESFSIADASTGQVLFVSGEQPPA